MKKKHLLDFNVIPSACDKKLRGIKSVNSNVPGNISDRDGRYAFSCSWEEFKAGIAKNIGDNVALSVGVSGSVPITNAGNFPRMFETTIMGMNFSFSVTLNF